MQRFESLLVGLIFLAAPAQDHSPGLSGLGYGWALFKMLVALVLVCGLCYMLLRWLSRRLALPQRSQENLRIIERCVLAPKQSLWLVEVADRVFLIGTSDGGDMAKLAELDKTIVRPRREQSMSFKSWLSSSSKPTSRDDRPAAARDSQEKSAP